MESLNQQYLKSINGGRAIIATPITCSFGKQSFSKYFSLIRFYKLYTFNNRIVFLKGRI